MTARVALLLALLCVPAAGEDGFRWGHDLDQARAQAKEEGRPLLVVFRCEP